MMQADLRELARLPDALAVCSSAGWTDQKHMLYLSLLQESFVNQLHGGEISLKGLVNLSPRGSRPKQSSKVDRAKFWTKVELEQSRSPCSQNPEDGEAHCMDDDASTTETVQESFSSQASATSPGQSSTSHFGKRKRSPSRTADSYKRTTYWCISSEGSDQNFIDEDVDEGVENREHVAATRDRKSADDTTDDQVRERRCIHEVKWMSDYWMQGLDHPRAKVMDQKDISRP